MITFLSSPKPFIGNAGVIQRTAIKSWKAVHPDVEVVIYGDGEGVAATCREMGVCHVPDVPCSPSGVPYFNSIAEHARVNAKYDVQCYLNCDIILTSDIIDAVKSISFDQYLVTGQRIDLHEGVAIDVTDQDWQNALLEIIKKGQAELHTPTGMDYFIFRRGMWQSLLPLVIGRGGYDEALVLYCLRHKLPFINATLSIIAIHQFHDYGHAKDGRKTVVMGQDATENIRIHRNQYSRPNSSDAKWLIVKGKVVGNLIQKDFLRSLENYVRFNMGCSTLSLAVRVLWRAALATGLSRKRLLTADDIVASVLS